MAELSQVDHSSSPPRIDIPREYNAAHDLIERNLRAGRGDKVAYIDDAGSYTYAELARRVDRFAASLSSLGLRMEDRIMLCLLDSIDFPVAFLGAIKAGVVPIAVNTLLKPQDYEFMLRDSRARVLFVSRPLLGNFDGWAGGIGSLERTIVSGGEGADSFDMLVEEGAERLLGADAERFDPAPTVCDDACFWLYSSGSTGTPKGTVHVHSSLMQTAELYARPVLGLRENDVVFSAAKLFFAYGLGNGLTFPLAVGATTVLMAERPTPDSVFRRLVERQPTVFYGVPTLFAAMLASSSFPDRDRLNLRICASAGEALPPEVGRRFSERTGVEILDGIGSTEMLHIFLSNRPGQVRYGTTGKPVPGYEVRLLDEQGGIIDVPDVIGDLLIRGPSAAAFYWNQRERSIKTFVGEWTRSGDKYVRDAEGYYTYAGRSDDMLKVSGQYVSPFEVESAIATHSAVLEAAVVGHPDADALIKPKAFVVLKDAAQAGDAMAEQLKAHVKDRLAPFKYPRWIEFVDELPKTATGKIQRFRLRG